MTKSGLVTTALSIGLLGTLATSTITVHAAMLHKGLPQTFVGKWKRHIDYQTVQGKTYEQAHLYQGTKHGFALSTTYNDPLYFPVRYNQYLGNHTYKIHMTAAYGGQHGIIFFHKYSPNKIGFKLSAHGKYMSYNSRKPVENYPYSWLGLDD